MEELTSRERHKSAPYLRLKNSKRTKVSKKLIVSNSQNPNAFLTSVVVNYQKIEGGRPFGEKKIPKKISQCRKKTERGTL